AFGPSIIINISEQNHHRNTTAAWLKIAAFLAAQFPFFGNTTQPSSLCAETMHRQSAAATSCPLRNISSRPSLKKKGEAPK
ncbi:MAG: hypothetical protein JXB10_05515, partial [Pirellulales bacterium]|nr:hypothetical protein [Pirellulales bacterium]